VAQDVSGVTRSIIALVIGGLVAVFTAGCFDSVSISNTGSKMEPLFHTIGTTRQIDIDVKPWSNPNVINVRQPGTVDVAVLTTPTLDAQQVVIKSIRFAGVTTISGLAEATDVDGDIDLLLFFQKKQLYLEPGDTEAVVFGWTDNGKRFHGIDAVEIVSIK